MTLSQTLQSNLAAIHADIAAACERSKRDPANVRLVVVTKYAQWPWVEELSRLHQTFGENRPQRLVERQPMLPAVEWHLIGQLQRNKVRPALLHAAMIHSVDSLKLLERIAQVATELKKVSGTLEAAGDATANTVPESSRHGVQITADRVPRLLLQVNVSGEASKSGFAPDELRSSWPGILSFASRVPIVGLMTMAEEFADPEHARPTFRALRELRDELAARDDSRSAGVALPELSMGMSGDFVPAVEAGATLVRIGSRVFAGLE